MAVLEWVVLSECECVRLGVSAAVCDVLCSVVVTAVSDTRHHHQLHTAYTPPTLCATPRAA